MLFRKKYERGLRIMREKNQEYLEKNASQTGEEATGTEEYENPEEREKAFREEKIELEKGDLPAMILSGLIVFGPIFLVLGGLLAFFWVYLH